MPEQKFNGHTVIPRTFKGGKYEFHGYDIGQWMWLRLDEVLSALELERSSLSELDDAADELGVLPDGTEIIRESGFYFLALFVSETQDAKDFTRWVMEDVVGSIQTKGYYSLEEQFGTRKK